MQPMHQWLVSDGHAGLAHVGNVRQAHLARLMYLSEHGFLLRPVLRARMRRSGVRRMPELRSAWRRCSSSKIATGRNPGADFRSGSTSVSKIPPSESERRRLRGAFLCEGNVELAFNR
jgi:hypothetical protein